MDPPHPFRKPALTHLKLVVEMSPPPPTHTHPLTKLALASDLCEVDGGGAAGPLVVDLDTDHTQIRRTDTGARLTLVLLLKTQTNAWT